MGKGDYSFKKGSPANGECPNNLINPFEEEVKGNRGKCTKKTKPPKNEKTLDEKTTINTTNSPSFQHPSKKKSQSQEPTQETGEAREPIGGNLGDGGGGCLREGSRKIEIGP